MMPARDLPEQLVLLVTYRPRTCRRTAPCWTRPTVRRPVCQPCAPCGAHRAYYDRPRARGVPHNAALRHVAHRLVGVLRGCLATRTAYDETVAWAHHAERARQLPGMSRARKPRSTAMKRRMKMCPENAEKQVETNLYLLLWSTPPGTRTPDPLIKSQ